MSPPARGSIVLTLADGLSLVLAGADGAVGGSGAVAAGEPWSRGPVPPDGRTRPYPTARLQKGLLLYDGARGLAEEGVGFGVPVLKRGVRAVFAGGVDAEAHDDGRLCTIRALYRMDLVERLAGAGGEVVAPRLLYAAKDALAALHRHAPAARGLLTAASSALRRRFGWETVYVPSGSDRGGTRHLRRGSRPRDGARTRRPRGSAPGGDRGGCDERAGRAGLRPVRGRRRRRHVRRRHRVVGRGDRAGRTLRQSVRPGGLRRGAGRGRDAAARPRAGRRPARVGRVRTHGSGRTVAVSRYELHVGRVP